MWPRAWGVSIGVVSKVVNRAAWAGLLWSEAVGMTEDELEARLYGCGKLAEWTRAKGDPVWIHNGPKRRD